METGMLWCDQDPNADLATKIRRAASYYSEKFGLKPNICYVHPSEITLKGRRTSGIQIRPNSHLRPGHLWLGVLSIPR
jgi:hypothetical protein